MPSDLSAYPTITLPPTYFPGQVYYVEKLADFPPPSGNVITIPAASSWVILGTVDLLGNRLAFQGNASLSGFSSETSFLISTGLPTGQYLLTSSWTLPISRLTIGCPADTFVFNLSGDDSNGLDVVDSNFGATSVVCGGLGLIENFSNVIFASTAFLNIKGGLTCNGTIGTFGVINSLFTSPAHTGAYLIFPNTLTILRRIRVNMSSMVVFSTGIDFQCTNIPNNSFILDTVSFSGPGTMLANITATDNRSQFSNCAGIINSASIAYLRLEDNVTTTVISASNTWTPILGATTLPLGIRFSSLSSGQVTYLGTRIQFFSISVTATMSSSNNVRVGLSISVNGAGADSYHKHLTTDGSGNLDMISTLAIVQLQQNDVVQVVVENQTNTANILIEDLSLSVFQIN